MTKKTIQERLAAAQERVEKKKAALSKDEALVKQLRQEAEAERKRKATADKISNLEFENEVLTLALANLKLRANGEGWLEVNKFDAEARKEFVDEVRAWLASEQQKQGVELAPSAADVLHKQKTQQAGQANVTDANGAQ